jgi:hypothetical protein
MKKQVAAVALALAAASPISAHAQDGAVHHSVGYGFHTLSAPIGVRWWVANQQVAVDLGFGIGSDDIGTESLMNWSLEAGVPILLRSWDRVHVLVRPGILYTSQDEVVGTTIESGTILDLSAELEAEVFLADNLSVSASHGFEISTNNPPGTGESTTNWSTFGNNFTTIGFHFYLWGGEK